MRSIEDLIKIQILIAYPWPGLGVCTPNRLLECLDTQPPLSCPTLIETLGGGGPHLQLFFCICVSVFCD